jgi:putative flippase GtrA
MNLNVESHHTDSVRRLAENFPRPLRFLIVGTLGLTTDLGVFTALPFHFTDPLLARLVSLAAATLVTWRLNRAVTFNASGRRQHDEALRYAGVTAVAQGTNFAVFSALVLTALATLPQAALICGAAIGAIISYAGHTRFAFAPVNPASDGEWGSNRP